jgi:hypothetical protein
VSKYKRSAISDSIGKDFAKRQLPELLEKVPRKVQKKKKSSQKTLIKPTCVNQAKGLLA